MNATERDVIERSIRSHGYHLYVVMGESSPRYAYTIGMLARHGCELVFAGGMRYDVADIQRIVAAAYASAPPLLSSDGPLRVDGIGAFELGQVSSEWVSHLMLGATEYHGNASFRTRQVVPQGDGATADVPVMRVSVDAPTNGAWKWLRREWPFPIPRGSVATTNLDALRGQPVTEAARWEPDQWELFAGPGPEVEAADVRVVPLGVLLGLDPSLEVVVALKVGEATWRASSTDSWHVWERAGS